MRRQRPVVRLGDEFDEVLSKFRENVKVLQQEDEVSGHAAGRERTRQLTLSYSADLMSRTVLTLRARWYKYGTFSCVARHSRYISIYLSMSKGQLKCSKRRASAPALTSQP